MTEDQKRARREYQARLRAERRAADLCVRCGRLPPGHGMVHCGLCRAKLRRAVQKLRAARKANSGHCVHCGKPSETRACRKCQDKMNAQTRAWRQRRKLECRAVAAE